MKKKPSKPKKVEKKSVKVKEPAIKEKPKGFFQELSEFATQGKVLDLTVGIMVGSSLTALVNSLVSNVLLPPINIFTDSINFNDIFINLSRNRVDTLAEAEELGLPVIKIGQFANDAIDFIIIAVVIFILVKKILGYQKKEK